MPYFELYKSDDLQAPVSLPQIVTMDYEAVLELGYALSSAQHTGNGRQSASINHDFFILTNYT